MAQDQVCALTHDGECTGECKTRKLKIVKMCLVIYISNEAEYRHPSFKLGNKFIFMLVFRSM